MAGEMSVASTEPFGPTLRAAAMLWPPAPAARSSTRLPAPHTGGVEHRLRGLPEPDFKGWAPSVPGGSRILPLLAGAGLVLNWIERHGVFLAVRCRRFVYLCARSAPIPEDPDWHFARSTRTGTPDGSGGRLRRQHAHTAALLAVSSAGRADGSFATAEQSYRLVGD